MIPFAQQPSAGASEITRRCCKDYPIKLRNQSAAGPCKASHRFFLRHTHVRPPAAASELEPKGGNDIAQPLLFIFRLLIDAPGNE
jgi:hypothetical protein